VCAYALLRFYFFFFSSRRRHTRWPRDWSSDVCSSDLAAARPVRDVEEVRYALGRRAESGEPLLRPGIRRRPRKLRQHLVVEKERSEERRVGKECRCRWSP